MPVFADLPVELLYVIFGYTIVEDKPVITSKPMPATELAPAPRVIGAEKPKTHPLPRITSRLTLAFASNELRPIYRKFIESYIAIDATVVRVDIVDYKFTHFALFLADLVKPDGLGYNLAHLNRFHFTAGGAEHDPANGVDPQLSGSYFAANLIFTANFDGEQTRLPAWLTKAGKIEKGKGHFRVFYKVTRAEESLALENMLSRQKFGRASDRGQLRFINEALRRKFTEQAMILADLAAVSREELEDINRGRVDEHYGGKETRLRDHHERNLAVLAAVVAPPAPVALPVLPPAPVALPVFNAAGLGGLPYFPAPAWGGMQAYGPQVAPNYFGGMPAAPPAAATFGQFFHQQGAFAQLAPAPPPPVYGYGYAYGGMGAPMYGGYGDVDEDEDGDEEVKDEDDVTVKDEPEY